MTRLLPFLVFVGPACAESPSAPPESATAAPAESAAPAATDTAPAAPTSAEAPAAPAASAEPPAPEATATAAPPAATSPATAKKESHAGAAPAAAPPAAPAASAPSGDAPAGADACQTKNFHYSQVAGACKSGGRKAAKGVMKGAVKKAKAAGTDLQCLSCHEDVKDFHLKSNAVADLKKWL